MALLPVELPEYNRPVKAIIKHFQLWEIKEVILISFDEDDCNWRFEEDNCELAMNWNVVYWEYLDEVKRKTKELEEYRKCREERERKRNEEET